MNTSLGGYTLIEALIVVAVSAIIFLGISTLFVGSREKVDFAQAKVDIDSKLKGYVNQVSTGTFAGAATHKCDLNSDPLKKRPILTFVSGGVSPGGSEKCTYLGKALLTFTGATKIYVYDVLGLRNRYSGATDSGQPAQSYAEANPEPAGEINSSTGNFDYLFVEEYEIPADLKVAYAKAGGNDANVLKIYSNLDANSGSSRGISVFASQFSASASDVSSTSLKTCIEAESGSCQTEYKLEEAGWDLCIQNSNNSRRAKFNIKPTSTGIVTKVTDGSC